MIQSTNLGVESGPPSAIRRQLGDEKVLKLKVTGGVSTGAEFDVAEDVVLIGRAQEAAVFVPDPGASRQHARIFHTHQGYFIEDLKSMNGTYLDGRRIQRASLRPGARISICEWSCTVEEKALPQPVADINVTMIEDAPVPEQPKVEIQAEIDATFAPVSEAAPLPEAGLRRAFDRLRLLLEVGEALASMLNPEELLQLIIDRLFEVFPQADQAAIMLIDPESGQPVPKLGRRRGSRGKEEILVSRTILRQAIEGRKSMLSTDAQRDARFGGAMSIVNLGIHSTMCVPMLAHEHALGVILVSTSQIAQSFTKEGLSLLTAIGQQAALALENAGLMDDLKQKNEELAAANEKLRATLRQVDMLKNVKEHMSKFVPQSARRMIEENPDAPGLEKQDRDVSIVFIDIRGYTKISESRDQSRVDFLVERYFSRFLDFIYEHGGDINEIAGDGLMIIFQDQDPAAHARGAAQAALKIYDETARINAELKDEFDPVAINVGINSGMASVGSVRFEGMAGTRWTFTAGGPTTILAARLGASATDGAILIGPETAHRLGEGYNLRLRGEQQLKNMKNTVAVFELVPG